MTDDVLQPFSFREAPVRGQWVRLDTVLRAIESRRAYPPHVARLLGEMLAATSMVAQGIKFDGAVALQSRGSGPLTTVLAECRERHLLRGIAHWPEGAPQVPAGSVRDMLGAGQLAITLHRPAEAPHLPPTAYQGLIELADEGLAINLERYFANSEQLPTRLFFAAAGDTLTGLLLQRLPVPDHAPQHELDTQTALWRDLQNQARNLDLDALARLEPAPLLTALFPTHELLLYPKRQLQFACTCSRQRSSSTLRALGREDLLSLLAEEEVVRVTCEVCGEVYSYSALDVHEMFVGGEPIVH